jgi:hypothetical protein
MLGSSSFQQREAAVKALKQRPDAVPALLAASHSTDLETRRRAIEILDFLERRPVRDLEAAVKIGHVDEALAILSSWRQGQFDEESWRSISDLATALVDLHHKKGGGKLDALRYLGGAKPIVATLRRVTEESEGKPEQAYFLRAGVVDLDDRRLKEGQRPRNWYAHNSVIVAAGPVRVFSGHRHVIFARGPVELSDAGDGIRNSLIVSSADVILKCDIGNSLVVARGKVISDGYLGASRVIAGKSVSTKQPPDNCIISQNDPNPLGFIRWTDPPKEKAKSK